MDYFLDSSTHTNVGFFSTSISNYFYKQKIYVKIILEKYLEERERERCGAFFSRKTRRPICPRSTRLRTGIIKLLANPNFLFLVNPNLKFDILVSGKPRLFDQVVYTKGSKILGPQLHQFTRSLVIKFCSW